MNFRLPHYFFIVFFVTSYIGLNELQAQTLWEEGKLIVKLKTGKGNKRRSIRSIEVQKGLQKIGITEARALFPQQNANQKRTATRLEDIYQFTFEKPLKVNQAISILEQETWVEYAEPSYVYAPLGEVPNDAHTSRHWGHSKTQVYDAWDISMGEGVVVGVVDSGYKLNHPDLKNQFQYNEAEVNGEAGVDDDQNGFIDDVVGYDFGDRDANVDDNRQQHGMQVAGIVSAEVNNEIGIFGVAPKAKVMPIKISRSNGEYVNTFEAVKYAADNGCKVINLSWGRQGFPSKYEEEIVNYCVNEKNAVIIGAAGNTANHSAYYPASYENVLSVAYSQSNDARHGTSTHNYLVDITAPGAGIPTTQGGAGYNLSVVGSSYSAPFVAGAAAVVTAAFPELSAKQVAELLRVTADEAIYEVEANKNFIDRLGKGRLNLLRALTQKDATPSIRLVDYQWQSSEGQRVLPGETLSFKGTLKNYLAPSSEITLTLSSPSAQVEIIEGTSTVSALETLAESAMENLSIRLAPDTPLSASIPIRLGIESEGYSDYQYIYLEVNPAPMVFKFNRIALGADIDGRIGITGTAEDPRGPGFYYDGGSNPLGNPTRAGLNLMGSSGLILAASPTQVSDAVFGTALGTLNDDFTAIQTVGLNGMQLYEYEGNLLSVKGDFEDYSSNENPLGVEITQKITGYTTSADLNYIINEYEITNVSGGTLREFYFTLFADWELPANEPEKAGWDENHRMAYLYQEEAGHYVGIKVVNNQPIHYTLSMDSTTTTGVRITDGFTDAEKYEVVSQGVVSSASISGNLAHVVGAQMSPFYKGNRITVAFVILYATSLEELLATAERSTAVTESIPVNVVTQTEAIFEDDMYFTVFPNPTSRQLAVTWGKPLNTTTRLSIYNSLGQLIEQKTINANQSTFVLNTSTYAAGVYIVQIQQGNQLHAKYFIVRQ